MNLMPVIRMRDLPETSCAKNNGEYVVDCITKKTYIITRRECNLLCNLNDGSLWCNQAKYHINKDGTIDYIGTYLDGNVPVSEAWLKNHYAIEFKLVP